jgi:hypothetical protein
MTSNQVKEIDAKYKKIEEDLKAYLTSKNNQKNIKEPELEYDINAQESK